jgi:hypothetical protein
VSWTAPTLAKVTTYQGGVPCDSCPRTDPPDMLIDTAALPAALRSQLGLRSTDRYICHACVETWVRHGSGPLTRAQFVAALGADHAAVVAHAWYDFAMKREAAGGNNLSSPDWAAFNAACSAVPALSGIGVSALTLASAAARQQAWTAFVAARPAGGANLGAADQVAFAAAWAAVRP